MDWEHRKTNIASAYFSALDGLGVVHALALRDASLDVNVERDEAMRRLAPSHAALREELGLGARRFCTAEQVHGAEVAVVDRHETGFRQDVDGLLTRDPSVCLGIYTADCCAVFLVDPVRRAIGLLHSGAKGTRLGIATVGLERMRREFGSVAKDLVAVLSPCIRPPRYEVDFAAEIRSQCAAAGVVRIFDSGACTGSDLERYYSYRMERGKTGRLLSLLALA
jgi:copper oxidase (laccase) domain-containing protein